MGDAAEETASASYGAVVRHHCAAITAYRNRDKKNRRTGVIRRQDAGSTHWRLWARLIIARQVNRATKSVNLGY